MRAKLYLAAVMLLAFSSSCKKNNDDNTAKKYPADLANAWMQMQIKLTKSTTGYNSLVSNRSFGYAGITMYESVLPVIPGSTSLLLQIGGSAIVPDKKTDQYYWPASLNAAMAAVTRQFFESTSAANLSAIDSLEAVYKTRFSNEAGGGPDKITNAENYGRQVATAIFN